MSNKQDLADEMPLDKVGLDRLIQLSGMKIDLLIRCDPDDSGSFLLFAKYYQNQITRQIYTQRNTPRKFRSLERAVEWGRTMGFRSVNMSMDYSEHPDVKK